MAERSKGVLGLSEGPDDRPELALVLCDDPERLIADLLSSDVPFHERTANGVHLAACWNAIEAAGGEPAIVAEALDTMYGAFQLLQGYSPDLALIATKLEALLRRAGRLS